jgi:hypothetical protein
MSILRSYIDKNNTIISNSLVNTARNPVIELNFGASDLIVPNFGYTRFIFDLDLSLLRESIQSGTISTGCTSGMTHVLNMTNTSSFDNELLNTFMSNERRRATSFDLILFRIPETCNPTPAQSAYTETVQYTYPNAVFAETWGTYTTGFIASQGYSSDNIIYAEGICSDDVDGPTFTGINNIGEFPESMNTFLGPFMSGGLAGYPFVGSVGLGAWASHVTNTGTLFISSMPHIGITEDGDVGYMYRRGQGTYLSNTCGAVAGAIGWVTSFNDAPVYTGFTDGGNYEFFVLTDILWPYKSTLTGMTYGEQMKFATDAIRDAAEQFIIANLPASVTAQTSNDVYFCNGIFINTDDGSEAYVDINRFKRYNTSANTWTDLTSIYLSGLTAATPVQTCIPTPQYWDEGVGYDYNDFNITKNSPYGGSTPLTYVDSRAFSTRPSNWYQTTTISNWSNPGIYNNKNEGTVNYDDLSIIARQHFEFGDEDIEMDMTSEIQGVLDGSITGVTGWGIAYLPQIENISGLTDSYSVAFFSRHTQTFYQPYLLTNYDDLIQDDRNLFLKNQENKLFLYIYQNGDLVNLDELPFVRIEDRNGAAISGMASLTTCLRTKGVYEVIVPNGFSGSPTPCEYFDIWSGLTINGQNIPNVTNQFILQNYTAGITIGSKSKDPEIYGFDFYGILQNEKILNSDIRKVGVTIKKAYTGQQLLLNVSAFYRVYVKEGTTEVQVQDWTPINRTPNEYYFIFDMRDKIPNEYYVDIQVNTSGEKDTYKKQLTFQIVNKK